MKETIFLSNWYRQLHRTEPYCALQLIGILLRQTDNEVQAYLVILTHHNHISLPCSVVILLAGFIISI